MKLIIILISSLFCCNIYSFNIPLYKNENSPFQANDKYTNLSKRPKVHERLFVSSVIEQEISRVKSLLKNKKLAWMFENCFPNTLDTTVRFYINNGKPNTCVYTGDIHAMWLRDSAAQVWPYVQFTNRDMHLKEMIAGVIFKQFESINYDPYANAFYKDTCTVSGWTKDVTAMKPGVHERKWELDSHCYPIRLAYHFWKTTGDTSVFDDRWISAVKVILKTFREQQRKNGLGSYTFQRVTDRPYDTLSNNGKGAPVKPNGLIVSSFRPSDDATVFQFLIPSNFFAMHSLRQTAEILYHVNGLNDLAKECIDLADEIEQALNTFGIYNHPTFGKIYAYEVDGFGNYLLMDDANVPSLLSMPYLGIIDVNDPIYQNTRKFVWSNCNPYFFKGSDGEGIGGPHVDYNMAWPMSIMMKAFTSQNDNELKKCIEMLINTDANTGFIHESFDVNNQFVYTRDWFAWQNSLFGELIIKIINDGKLYLLNEL